MKLYHTYNAETFVYETSNYFDNCPENGTDVHPTDNFLIRKWDVQNQFWYEGATAEELAAAIEVPTIISRRQLKLALVLSGFNLSIIEGAINGLPEPNRSIALISWNDAITFDRTDGLLQSLAASLEIDLNTLFIEAAKL